MKNPFKSYSRKKGLPDSILQHGNLPHNTQQDDSSTQISVSAPPPPLHHLPHPAAAPANLAPPSGYPYNNNYGQGSQDHNLHTTEPPIAYPYRIQPDEGESRPIWEFNTGNNVNTNGKQRGGRVKVANSATGSALPFTLPQNGRFLFNTGCNFNQGESQENGHVEFGNVGYGASEQEKFT